MFVLPQRSCQVYVVCRLWMNDSCLKNWGMKASKIFNLELQILSLQHFWIYFFFRNYENFSPLKNSFDDLSPQVSFKLCKKLSSSSAEALYHFLLHLRNPPTISNLWIWLGNILTPNMSPCLQTVLQIRSAFSVRWVQTVLMGGGCQSWEKILFAVWWCVQYGCHSGSESACAC